MESKVTPRRSNESSRETPLRKTPVSTRQDMQTLPVHPPVHKKTLPHNSFTQEQLKPFEDMEAALQRGDLDYIRNVELDVLLNYRAEDNRSALHIAVAKNRLDCCQEIYRRCPSLLYIQTNKHRSTALHNAAWNGNPDIVKFLITADAELDPANKLLSMLDINKTPALNMAADAGKLEAAKVLIEAEPKMVGMVNAYGYSPMHLAVRNQNLEMVKLLVEADPNVEYFADQYGNIPILTAIRQAQSAGNASASAKIRKLLLKMQPSQGKAQIGDGGWTPLHHATCEGDLSAIDDIIRFCPGSWEAVDKEGQNFLHLAAKRDIVKVVKYILETKETAVSAVNALDNDGNTPLHLAALNMSISVAHCLLYDPRVNKATVNKQGKYVLDSITFDYDKRKAGIYSVIEHAQRGDLDYFMVVALDVIMNSRDERGDSVLSIVVLENHLDCCEEIFKRCPSLLYAQNYEGYTALHHAAYNGKLDMLKFLISATTKRYHEKQENTETSGEERILDNKIFCVVDKHGFTALHSAVIGEQLGAVKLLIEADFEKEILGMFSKKLSTALHLAVEKQNYEIVKVLVEADPYIEYSVDILGETPLLLAIRMAHSLGNLGVSGKIRKLLLKMQPSHAKARIGDNGWTSLHYASHIGDLSAIEDIIRFCPGCWEEVDNKGQTFLHVAIIFEHVKVVKFVLGTTEVASGVLNVQENTGKTPLHVAALSGNESMTLSLLYDPRVNKTTMSKEGQHVLDSITFDYDKRKAGVYGISDRLDQKDLKEQSDFDLVVGALIATVSFTAGITVPGGYNSDGPDKGLAVLTKKGSFEAFVLSNSLALVFSLHAVFSHFCTRRLQKKEDILHQLNVATFCTLSAIFAMMVAFITGSYAVLANSTQISIIIFVNCCCFFISTCHPMWKVLSQQKRFLQWFHRCAKDNNEDSLGKVTSKCDKDLDDTMV